jgi:hypothetical protein
VDGFSNVYVADTGNDPVQEWGPAPNGAPLVTVDPQSQTVLESAPITITVSNPAPTTTVVLSSNNASVSGNQYLDATASSGECRSRTN